MRFLGNNVISIAEIGYAIGGSFERTVLRRMKLCANAEQRWYNYVYGLLILIMITLLRYCS